jgi:hypothetical protein
MVQWVPWHRGDVYMVVNRYYSTTIWVVGKKPESLRRAWRRKKHFWIPGSRKRRKALGKQGGVVPASLPLFRTQHSTHPVGGVENPMCVPFRHRGRCLNPQEKGEYLERTSRGARGGRLPPENRIHPDTGPCPGCRKKVSNDSA